MQNIYQFEMSVFQKNGREILEISRNSQFLGLPISWKIGLSHFPSRIMYIKLN